MGIEDLKSKVRNFIIEFRKVEIEKGEIATSLFYAVPCQVTMLWFQNERKDYNLQIFIFTHWNNKQDLEIDIYGPINFSEFSYPKINFRVFTINSDKRIPPIVEICLGQCRDKLKID